MIKIGLYSEDRTMFPLLASALGRDFQVQLAGDERGMNAMVAAGNCEVMILDLAPGRSTLLEMLGCFERLVEFDVPAIVLAEDALMPTAMELVEAGAYNRCRRPPNVRELKTLLTRAYENAQLKKQAQVAAARPQQDDNTSCDRLIGSSPRMQKVYQLVRKVASLNCAVFINGESGTGKELIARAIHNMGGRSGKPFVAVSCGAIPETMIEAELFGHEKGAFTGAVGAREGYLEQAGDGTLFLDEIGDLSLFTQVKLLRVLQQMEFSRLGSGKMVPLRARIVFATHRDLAKMVAEGTFRQDLYYRINVMKIESPALNEHPEDIPQIAQHFLRQYAETFQKPMEQIEPAAMNMLQSYSWPGNVRELENVMQRAIILASDTVVRAEDLTISVDDVAVADEDETVSGDVISIADFREGGSFEQMINDYKIRVINSAIREHNGNKSLAARSLGISRAYIHRLLRQSEEGEFEMELARAANA